MRGWIGRFIRRGPAPAAPVESAPVSQRLKRYTAASGYVYEYFNLGHRDESGTRRHRFHVSADRKNWFEVEVAVEDQGIRTWELDNGRVLNSAERYAVAKLALFDAFDEGESPEALRAPVQVPALRIARLLASVDL
ncbi:MAG TPA: hypothetical protein PKJ41_08135 [Bryobacteraceae bacterium]|nr:hypothetical protein [Bryobacteraceae bacterium]HPT25345.1 hypothetical protein [Bryobacteraceae bacterium]